MSFLRLFQDKFIDIPTNSLVVVSTAAADDNVDEFVNAANALCERTGARFYVYGPDRDTIIFFGDEDNISKARQDEGFLYKRSAQTFQTLLNVINAAQDFDSAEPPEGHMPH